MDASAARGSGTGAGLCRGRARSGRHDHAVTQSQSLLAKQQNEKQKSFVFMNELVVPAEFSMCNEKRVMGHNDSRTTSET